MREGQIGPRTVLVVAIGYLLLALMMVGVVDVFDVAGLRSRLGREDGAPLWLHLFQQASITEVLQWSALAVLALLASHGAGRLAVFSVGSRASWQREQRFLTLLAVSALLMLIEDAGNPSHRLAQYVYDLLGQESLTIEVIARFPVHLIVAGVPLYTFLRYWPSAVRGRPGAGLLLGGIGAYGVTAFSSGPANALFDFYERVGPVVAERLLGGRLLPVEPPPGLALRFSEEVFTGALFMDYVYEESIELIGVALLLAGAAALTRHLDGETSGVGRASAGRRAAEVRSRVS